MQRLSISSISLLILLIAAQPVNAQTLSMEQRQAIDELAQSELSRLHIPGLSLAIGTEGRLSYAQAYGTAQLEHSVPATPETLFRTASIAKPMTATAVLRLVESGKIQLDDPIQQHCPAFPEKEWPVTIRQLLSHQGGIRHYKSREEAAGKEHYFTLQQAIGIFSQEPLLYPPGSRYQYSTYGFNLLGCAVEGASGTRFEDFLQQQVFEPAGMIHTRSDNHFLVIPNRSGGYSRVDQEAAEQLPEYYRRRTVPGAIINDEMHDTSMKIPGGGLLSTASDLVRFGLATIQGRLLKPPTLEQMLTEQSTADGEKHGYGLGWGIGEVSGRSVISHSGGQAGVSTLLVVLPEDGLVIAAMCNLRGANLRPLVWQALDLLSEEFATSQ